jgi:hypothetical protein
MIKLLTKILKSKFGDKDFRENDLIKYYDFLKFNEIYKNNNVVDKNLMSTNQFKKSLSKELDINFSKSSKNVVGVNIENLLTNIRYIYQLYDERTTKLIFKSVFNIFNAKMKSFIKNGDLPVNVSFDKKIENLILVFRIEENMKLIMSGFLFNEVLKAISSMFKVIKRENKQFIAKNSELMGRFFLTLDGIFDNLYLLLDDIIKFLKQPNSQIKLYHFNEKVKMLKKITKFITTIIKINNVKDFNALTETMMNFNTKILEKIITLIFILLELNSMDSFAVVINLLDFIYNFIHGPNIENLKSLFNNGYFKLMKYVITKIDYYKVFLMNINKADMHRFVNTLIDIEYKIMQVFFIYFNIIVNDCNKSLYNKVRDFYLEEKENITNKMRKIYYIMTIEAKNKKENIENFLLYYVDQRFYTEDDLDLKAGNVDRTSSSKETFRGLKNSNLLRNMTKKLAGKAIAELHTGKQRKDQKISDNNKYIIKFELLLIYYNLYVIYTELIVEDYFTDSRVIQSGIIYDIYNFFFNLFTLIRYTLMLPYHLVRYCISMNKKKDINKKQKKLFSSLYKIDEKYQKVNINEIMLYMKNHVTNVELILENFIYKVYFPILSKSQILKNTSRYLNIASSELENYIYYILNNYDKINIEITQNNIVDHYFKLPVFRYIVSNINMFKTLSLLVALLTNFFILASYSTFNILDTCKEDGDKRFCPTLFYEPKYYEGKIYI